MIEVSRLGALTLQTRSELSGRGAAYGPGRWVTGSDFLMDGGVTAAYWHGDLAPQ